MEFITNMYVSDGIKNPKNIVKMLKKKQSKVNIYCICINENSNSIIEIIHSHEIHKQVYSNINYIIIGIVTNKDEAKEMICKIIKEVYERNNELTNIKQILLSLYKKEV